jgi:elongator complex protein 5
MAHTNLAYRRTHNLLLISKLLSQQSQTSPFTLLQDTLEQSAKPLGKEYLRRAKSGKDVVTIFLAFETFSKPRNVDHFVPCDDIGKGIGWQKLASSIVGIQRQSLCRSEYP